MFCNQCEQTARGTACSAVGVCGKKPEVASLQDLLTFRLRTLAGLIVENGRTGDQELNRFLAEALFATLTNVNFDPEAIVSYIETTESHISSLPNRDHKDFKLGENLSSLVKQGEELGRLDNLSFDPDRSSLKQLLLYGVRGVAAYAHHAAILGEEDPEVYEFICRALSSLGQELEQEDLLKLVMECGRINLRAMELLDAGNTKAFGHPVPTSVPLGHRAGKCILVSGHDLWDLKNLLKMTAGTGINVYTHGEMLPAHGYPELKKYPHLVGHYGTAWQNQKREFAAFPGAILMTTNCIQEPQASYQENIFTTGPVGWPGVKHLANGDFEPLIKRAMELPGFSSDEDKGSVMVGFARQAVLSVADSIVDAVKSGAIRHFFLVGGCDGAKAGRSYYSEFVDKTPPDTVVLTLACGKFRFFDHDLGEIAGLPRLLDIGQCNDAYSAVQIAVALAQAFNCGVNDLPLSMILSWYEQKAVSILLSLLYLGIKNIRLGPSLPAFISPQVFRFLSDNFGIRPITTPDEDLEAILGK